MPRQKNTRPTNIYWLYDTRPETVAVFGPEGQPFYCGKTVYDVLFRLRAHRQVARKHPNRPVSIRITEIGDDHVTVQTKETVPLGQDWAAREREWIKIVRAINPNCVNVSSGGQGTPGYIPNAKTRVKMRDAKLGKTFSIEHRDKLSDAHTGKKRAPFSAEHRANMSRAWKTRLPASAETRAKMRQSKLDNPKLSEHMEKMRIASLGRTRSPNEVVT